MRTGLTETIEVKNLTSLKRTIAIPGIVIRVLEHWQENLRGTTRTPTKVQTNGYWFDGPNHAGKIGRMWAPIPKASELRFNPDGSVTFHPGTDRSWTLAFEVQS